MLINDNKRSYNKLYFQCVWTMVIYKNLADCPQGVYVKFYSMATCAVDSTFIGDVSSLTVFTFRSECKLITSVTEQDVSLNRDFEILVPVSNGNFSFIAWTGVII